MTTPSSKTATSETTRPEKPPKQDPKFWAGVGTLLHVAVRLVRGAGAKLIAMLFAVQIGILVLGFPLLRWLFREALRANGMVALDLGALQLDKTFTVTLALILVICALAFWLISLQFTLLVVVLHFTAQGRDLRVKPIVTELLRVTRKLLRPSSLALLFYLFIVLPLTGFGFTSLFVQGISIPTFISGELAKSTVSNALFGTYLLFLGVLNSRWALTLPIFALTDATGGQSLRSSWRLTRGLNGLQPVLAIAAVITTAGLATVALVITSFLPTVMADELAPALAPTVAAYSLGVAQVLGLLLTSLVTALVGAIVVSEVMRRSALLPEKCPLRGLPDTALPTTSVPVTPPPVTPLSTTPLSTTPLSTTKPRKHRKAGLILAGSATVIAVLLGAAATQTLEKLSTEPTTLVIGHRGFSGGGVENTISGLDAAAASGADLVEMDVMQTQDGKFVVMHDATLKRLTGQDLAVKDLTLNELTALTVTDLAGHEDLIPSLADYVTHAANIEMPLLIEIKLSGAETPNHVDLLIAELESLDALENNIYHTLDRPSVERLKHLRPDLTVGYILAFAAQGVPDTPADFIVVEEWTATDQMQQAAIDAGKGFMVWTVNDEPGMREHLRRNTDGMITDHPDTVVEFRKEMHEETGFADLLVDALNRFVVVF